jgi:hypothetical protein
MYEDGYLLRLTQSSRLAVKLLEFYTLIMAWVFEDAIVVTSIE